MIVKDLAYERLVIKDQVTQIAALAAQRDELLAVLIHARHLLAKEAFKAAREDLNIAVLDCDAAIAKCKPKEEVRR